jgi:hypothetical protein
MITPVDPSIKAVITLPISKERRFEMEFTYPKDIIKDILKITICLQSTQVDLQERVRIYGQP